MKKEIEKYFDKLWPICRSITGNGLRESLKIISELIPLELTEVPSGTKVFDWEIPDEWNIRDAYIICPDGKMICAFKSSNLHVLNYSIPVDKEMSFEELKPHLFTIKELPDAIPYLTSYYKRQWGFCIAYNQFKTLSEKGTYKVFIDSDLKPGSLTYGQHVIKGKSEKEILISTYLCHPSLASNELSGPLVSAMLYQKIASLPDPRFTYRFVFAPETIGVIAFLNAHGFALKEKIQAGFVITCVGDDAPFNYKRSKSSDAEVNRLTEHVLTHRAKKYSVRDFSVGGSDERQYCSPGFNMPVGSLMRSVYKEYKEYHTSLDNKSFISFSAMEETVDMYFNVVKALELNCKYMNTIPYGEPMLGKRDLYVPIGGRGNTPEDVTRRLHLLSFADGKTDLLEIAERAGQCILDFEFEVNLLLKSGLLTIKED